MELTVRQLKQLLEGIDDKVIVADLGIGNDRFRPFVSVKRLLLLQDTSGQQYLTINGMGSHFTGNGQQSRLTLVPCHEYVGDYLVNKCATTCAGLENCKLKTDPFSTTKETDNGKEEQEN
jgi:hypothetical protein